MRQAIRRDQAAIGDAAGEARPFRTEQGVAHGRVNAVGADHSVGRDRRAILEMGFDSVTAIDEMGEALPQMHPIRRHSIRQGAVQVAAMERVVGRAERGLDGVAERRAKQHAAIIPATPLVERHRPDACLRQFFGNAQPVENARRVRADIDAGADFSGASACS